MLLNTFTFQIKEKGFELKTKKILIAENDPDHIELLIEELNVVDAKTVIIIKKDGQELRDYFQQSDTGINVEIELSIDLVILGLNLPEINGIAVLRYLKNDTRYRSIPVIIFSNTSDTKTISEVHKNGANGFIKIPSSFHEFKENIKKLRKYLLN